MPEQQQPNVLILNWRDLRNPRAGGAEIHMWEVFTRAASLGWKVTLLCCSFPGAKDDEVIDGIRVVRRGGEFSIYGIWPFAFRRLARQIRPDVVVEFMNKLPFFSPCVTRLPIVCYVHHLFGDAAHHEFPRPLAWIVKTSEALIPFAYRNVPFLTGAESTIQELAGLGIPRQQLNYAPYGVDIDQLVPGRKSDSPRILFVGRVKKYKGIGDLLSAVHCIRSRIPELHVDIVGEGDARADLERQTQRLGLDDIVTFHGFVDDVSKTHFYQRAWVACIPSAKEGFGLTIPEAALCETPTVGYDVPGVRDAIIDGKTGLLVHHGDVQALSDALSYLIQDREPRISLGKAARAHYSSFSWHKSAEAMLDIIRIQINRPDNSAK